MDYQLSHQLEYPAPALDQRRRALLIVEDPMAQNTLCSILAANGYMAQRSDSAKAGLALYQTWQPDIILLDVQMPPIGGSGETFLTAYSKLPGIHPRVIILNGSLEAPSVAEWLDKPFEARWLLRLIKRLLENVY